MGILPVCDGLMQIHGQNARAMTDIRMVLKTKICAPAVRAREGWLDEQAKCRRN
jgi:hypothetical protein